jgi:hypothetical protein
MDLEFECKHNGIAVKQITIRTHREINMVQILELRENYSGKSGWVPVFFKQFDRYHEARACFIGLVAEIAYECANNTQDTNNENLFERGSFPSTMSMGHRK